MGKFSVQMDSTQDIAVQDQLAVVLRYVKSGVVHEHLYRFLRVEGSLTAATLYEILKKELDSDGLSMANVIGDSFDGAPNMSGSHRGLHAEIRQASPNSVYIHCYAPVHI